MKKEIDIRGMHCRSCEMLIEERLSKINGIREVRASTKRQKAYIVANDNLRMEEVNKAIEELGYKVGIEEHLSFVTKDKEDYKTLLTSVLLLAALYLFAKAFNFEGLISPAGTNNASLPVVFTFGITAGFSTCMAVVGGLVLGVSARFAEKHPKATKIQKFRPHLFFNLGRIISYTFLGGVIGLLGSAIKISTFGLGAITLVLGLYLLFVGLQITQIFPRISALPLLPKAISKTLRISDRKGNEYSHKNSFILGALTFFLPCGFTQAMQLYAVSTGSFVSGALIMGAFALGTAPGLLGLGGLISAVEKGYFSKLFFKFVGLVVIVLSVYNITTGINLTGLNVSWLSKNENSSGTQQEENTETPSSEAQVIKSKYTAENGKISPDKFKVQVNRPVRFEIYAEDDGLGCMGSIMIPGLANEPQFFEKGKTVVFEFTPNRKGSYRITCAMGVPSGIITVE